MSIIIPNNLPAKRLLEKENIFVMTEKRAEHQDIRPLRIVILNLMPDKITTESQFLRLLSNTPLQVEVTLLHLRSHITKHTPANHLASFYKTWSNIKEQRFDGIIVTGAPVEHLDFEQVDYWEEFCSILAWSEKNVFCKLYVCWGAQAALYYHYGIKKHPLKEKIFGVFPHKKTQNHAKLLKGFDDIFIVPHSRNTQNSTFDIKKLPQLTILAESKEAGACIVEDKQKRMVFVSGHFEYDRDTLKKEYQRDLEKRLKTQMPKNYFPQDNPAQKPIFNWHSCANLLYYNWLNFYVYQETPFELTDDKSPE